VRRRAYEIVETGASADPIGRSYDIISTIVLLANLMVTILYTFDEMELRYGGVLLGIEAVSVAFFAVDYVLLKNNPWNGMQIRDLDISRQTIIVMVKRNGTMLVPKGSMVLLEGDKVILYSQEYIANQNIINV